MTSSRSSRLRLRLTVLGAISVIAPLLVLLAVTVWTSEDTEVTSDGTTLTRTSDVSPWIPITTGLLVIPLAALAWWWAGREVALHARAARAVEDERRLVEDVSHQLRTPIAVLLTNADVTLADTNATTDDLRTALRSSRTTGASMQSVVEQLLTTARHRQRDANTAQTDLVKIAAEVCRLHTDHAATRDVTIRRTGPGRLHVAADADAVTRALDALVDNAVRHSPDGGDVRVSISTDESGTATVAVSDHGPGIPAEHHARIFDRYWSTDPASSGIGLAIVAEAARDAFDVSVTSPTGPGGGTSITLRFAPPAAAITPEI